MGIKDRLKLGSTGAFPDGKISKDDEGELRMAATRQGNLVHIDFGERISWFALDPNQAKHFAALLMQCADGGPKPS